MTFNEALNLNNETICECTAEKYAKKVLTSSLSELRDFNKKIIDVEAKQNGYKYIPAGNINIMMGSASGFDKFFKEAQKLIKYDTLPQQDKNKFVMAMNDLIAKIKSNNPRM